MTLRKRILICGAGSIGVYLGAKLHAKGYDVKLFGRRKLKNSEDNILIQGRRYKIPKKIFRNLNKGIYDFVFLTAKLYDSKKILKMIKHSGIKSRIFCTIHNGLVNNSEYEKILNKKISSIVVFSGFNLLKDRIIVTPTSIGWRTEFTEDGRKISKLLLNSGIPCYPDKKFDSLEAEKTIVNCCLNGLSAIENKTFCSLFKNKRIVKRIEGIFNECYAILKKCYNLRKATKIKKEIFSKWARLDHYSSTCQDLHSGRKTEINFFNGYIVKLGKKYKISAPYNQTILDDIKKAKKKQLSVQVRDI